jgi:hypothetical protein
MGTPFEGALFALVQTGLATNSYKTMVHHIAPEQRDKKEERDKDLQDIREYQIKTKGWSDYDKDGNESFEKRMEKIKKNLKKAVFYIFIYRFLGFSALSGLFLFFYSLLDSRVPFVIDFPILFGLVIATFYGLKTYLEGVNAIDSEETLNILKGF